VGVVARAVWGAAAVSAAYFAVQGGEYSTTDLRAQRARRAALVAEVDTLARVVDSLRGLERRLRTDVVLQERVAREEFGMVRGEKELLYRFADARPPAPPDSAVSRGGSLR
jgi:cell division protein FtsB